MDKLTITNIEWDIDMEEVLEKLEYTFDGDVADMFEIPVKAYVNMSLPERRNLALKIFSSQPKKLYEYLLLPEGGTLDDSEIEEDNVADYLSDAYGYCIKSLNIRRETV